MSASDEEVVEMESQTEFEENAERMNADLASTADNNPDTTPTTDDTTGNTTDDTTGEE